MKFNQINKKPIPSNTEVLMFNKKWIDPDIEDSKGVRIGYLDEDGVYHSVEWSSYSDCYYNRNSEEDDNTFSSPKAVDQVPTHWAFIEVPLTFTYTAQ
jgi:hypothetical protein